MTDGASEGRDHECECEGSQRSVTVPVRARIRHERLLVRRELATIVLQDGSEAVVSLHGWPVSTGVIVAVPGGGTVVFDWDALVAAAWAAIHQGGRMSEDNPFYGDPGHGLITQDMTDCDICGRMCDRALCQSIVVVYGSQAKTASEVCADCMHRMGFRPQRVLDEADWQRMADGLALLRRMKEKQQ